MPLLGVTWPVRYLHFVVSVEQLTDHNMIFPAQMPTLRELVSNIFGTLAPGLTTPTVGLLTSATVMALTWAWWRGRQQPPTVKGSMQTDLLWALACLVGVLIAPHFGPHDDTVFLVPAWILAAYALSGVWCTWQSRCWLGLLWAGYVLSLLGLLMMDIPGLAVIPIVLMLLLAVILLTWQLAGNNTLSSEAISLSTNASDSLHSGHRR